MDRSEFARRTKPETSDADALNERAARHFNVKLIDDAERAARNVLLHNTKGPYGRLPRTAGWGYPEPYTRDLMFATLGISVTGNEFLMASLRRVFRALAKGQSRQGQIPGLASNPDDLGSSDTTPLFLIGLAIFRKVTGDRDFLDDAADHAFAWMCSRPEDGTGFVPQQPKSDWRDELWVSGYSLYVNSLVYIYLGLWGRQDEARALKAQINRCALRHKQRDTFVYEGLAIPGEPYYASWVLKTERDCRFDLLGNSLAILSGIAEPAKAAEIIDWTEATCRFLGEEHLLAPHLGLPPCLMPYIQPGHADWHPGYEAINRPGEYHNGGVWPFVCGVYVAAIVAAGKQALAEEKLMALTRLVRLTHRSHATYGFNEWCRAQDGKPMGWDWQTWSAAMYLYAAYSVKNRRTPFFEELQALA